MSLLGSAWDWISGDSFGASLAKTAVLAYGMSKLSNSMSKSASDAYSEAEDVGARIQLNPDTSHKIPVLYGSAYIPGAITDVELTTDYKTMRYCLTIAEQTGNKLSDGAASTYTFNDVYINNNRVIFKSDGVTVDYTLDISGNQDVSLRDIVKVYMYAPDPLQPDGYTGTTPAATSVMSHWDATYKMSGLIYSIVEVTYNRAKNVTGIPECKFHITNNMSLPGDVLYDYMTSSHYGGNISTTEIDDSLTTLNTYATTGFTYTLPNSTSSTATYSINGTIDTSNNVLSNMEEIAANANSWISYNILEGKWRTVINKEESIVATLTDSEIVNTIAIGSTSLSQLNSIAEVKFQNAEILDKTDYVRVTIPPADLLDNEPETVLEISLPFVNKQALALKIGLQYLKQGRIDKTISFTTDYSYMNLKAGDIVGITSSVYGYTNKPFRITDVEEVEGTNGEILINFEGLEYNADVYSGDISEYTVETDDGLIGIGTIGTPGIVQFSKIERDAHPRVRLESVSPSGVVEALEFWVTSDTAVAESERTYRLLSTRYPTELVTETWPEGTNVSYYDDTLSSGNYLIKTRGVNSIVVGPFCEPSGLVEFVPQQTTDAIGPDTDMNDELGQLVGYLSLFSVLNKLFDMFDDTTVEESLFDRLFGTFKDTTGVDLVGEASGGSLVVAADIKMQDEGVDVTTTTSTVNFVGAGVTVTGDGNVATVTIDGATSGGTSGGTSGETGSCCPEARCDGNDLEEGDLVAWNGNKWAVAYVDNINWAPNCEPGYVPPDPPEQCVLATTQLWPPDRPTFYEDDGINPVLEAPSTGSYFAKYYFTHGETGSHDMYSPLQPGDGSAYLYLSDGTLVETLTSADIIIHNDVVEFPWADRIQGSDYYILIDENLVYYCECISTAITQPTPWNVNIAPYDVDPLTVEDTNPRTLVEYNDFTYPSYNLSESCSLSGAKKCINALGNLELTFNEEVVSGLGSVTLRNITDGINVVTLPASGAVITGTTMNFGALAAFVEEGKVYRATFEEDCARSDRGTITINETYCNAPVSTDYTPSNENSDEVIAEFTVIDPLYVDGIAGWTNYYAANTSDSTLTSTKVNLRSDILFKFTRDVYNDHSVEVGTGQDVYLYKGDGTLIQVFDLTDAFNPEHVSELWKQQDWPGDVYSNDTILLNPTHMLEQGTEYYIQYSEGCFRDPVCNVDLPGVSDTTTLRFKTYQIELGNGYNQPAPNPTIPYNDMPIVIPTAADDNLTTYSGSIEIVDDLGNVVMTIPADSPALKSNQWT